MNTPCSNCGGEVRIALTGYYCRGCGENWEFIAPENRQ